MGGCDDGIIVDDWGPSAGEAVVRGTVRDASGDPVAAGMEVLLTLCGPPVGGLAGRGSTDGAGGYSVTGGLPPAGAFPGPLPDSVLVTCTVVAGQGFARSAPSVIPFFSRSEPRPVEIHLQAPAP